MDETPRSRYARSASSPSSRSRRSPSANSVERKRVAHATSAANSSKRAAATGSRSMQMSVPAGPIRSATRRAWPPAPKVQSTAMSPGCGSRISISSPARTGTCVRVMSRRIANVLRDVGDLAWQVGLVVRVAGAVPDLEVVVGAENHDVLGDAPVLEQATAQSHPTRGVELNVEGAAVEEAVEPAAVSAERVKLVHEAALESVEVLGGEDRDTRVDPFRKD